MHSKLKQSAALLQQETQSCGFAERCCIFAERCVIRAVVKMVQARTRVGVSSYKFIQVFVNIDFGGYISGEQDVFWKEAS